MCLSSKYGNKTLFSTDSDTNPKNKIDHTHTHTPWAQQRSCSSFAGLCSLSAVVHPAADHLVRDHHVQEKYEYGRIHSAARAPLGEDRAVKARICSTGLQTAVAGGLLQDDHWWWRWGGEGTRAQVVLCPLQLKALKSRDTGFWCGGRSCATHDSTQYSKFTSWSAAERGIFFSLSHWQQLTGDIGGCCRRDATVAKDMMSSPLHDEWGIWPYQNHAESRGPCCSLFLLPNLFDREDTCRNCYI